MLLAIMLWTVSLIVAAPLIGWRQISVEGTGNVAFMRAARAAAASHRGNVAIVLLGDGRIAARHNASVGEAVTGDTIFQMASVSKMVTAWGVMRLAEQGRVDLDAPVSRYLRRWQLPPTEYDNDAVTIRRLLSHTAGLGDDLGYCGFAPGQPMQSLTQSLDEAADACPWRSGRVRVDDPAGDWRYSGGGYSLLQLLIEDVSGQSFADYMEAEVLHPLGMMRSTFRTGARGLTGLAAFHDVDGSPAVHNHYTAAAAASLYSTANDMARFALAHLPGRDGAAPGRGVILPDSVLAMRQPHAQYWGVDHFGLGVFLYSTGRSGKPIFGHDGGNSPAVNTTIRVEPATGDALIVLSTGGDRLASRLGAAWLRDRQVARTPFQLASLFYGAAVANFALLISGVLLCLFAGGVAMALHSRKNRHSVTQD